MPANGKKEFREWARTDDRAVFLEIQKRRLYQDFYCLIDPSDPDYNKRFKLFRGGRGAGRTTSLARCLVDIMADRKVRVCAARSFQNSISESNKQSIELQIEALGLSDRFTITRDYIECDNGSYCIFRGMERNTQSIKSLESIDILWIEEAAGLTQKTLSIVEPTIRKDGSQLWFSWNPDNADAPIEKLYAQFSDRAVVKHTNFLNNPWCPESLIKGAADLKAMDYERYLHDYEGAYWSQSEASILGKRIVSFNFEIDETFSDPFIGVDWGYSQDPTAVIEAYIREQSLYIRRAAGKVRLELDDTAGWLINKVPNISNYASYADSARPETISKVKQNIPLIRGVEKGKGSVEDGIVYLQSFKEIVVHPECQHDTLSELKAYSYKVDANDNVTAIVLDKDNHYADALRYALSPKIKGKVQFYIASA
jgi:phage terminase large subunit